jgi:hypothetical protein
MKFLKRFFQTELDPVPLETKERLFALEEILDKVDPFVLMRFFINYFRRVSNDDCGQFIGIILKAFIAVKGSAGIDVTMYLLEQLKEKDFGANEERMKRWKNYGDFS